MWSLCKALRDVISAILSLVHATKANTEAIRENTTELAINTIEVSRLNDLLEKLLCHLRDIPDPGPISILVISEDNAMLQFKVALPALPDPPGDIVSGELTISIAGGAPQVIVTAKDQTEVAGLEGNDGDQVVASFAWVDDATPTPNKSVNPSTIDAALVDTIPPPDPGVLGLVVTGET